MNWDQLKGQWHQFTGKLRSKWGKLTDEDWTMIAGKERPTRWQAPGALRSQEGCGREGSGRFHQLLVSAHGATRSGNSLDADASARPTRETR
jgi:hypothetical protein